MTPHPISEFCIAAGTGLVSYLCMTQIAGIDPLPVVGGALGTYLALAQKESDTSFWQAIKIMFVGMAWAAAAGVVLTAIVHKWIPEASGIAVAFLCGALIGYASERENAQRLRAMLFKWLNRKAGGQ
jgi:hypothetical protein